MARSRPLAVLVATDGSKDATAAVSVAAALPWPPGTRLHGVVVRPLLTSEIPPFAWAELERSLTRIAEATRAALSRRWPSSEVRVIDSPTVPAILARAERLGAQVIVLGSQGHGPVARLLVGSTSLGVVRGMRHAALVVRGRPREIARVAIGFDGSPSARRATGLLASLGAPRGGRATIIHVLEQTALPSAGLLPGAARRAVLAQAAEVDSAAERKASRDAEAAAAELSRAGWKVDVVLRRGAPLHELLEGARRVHAQLLVVGAHGHTAIERLLLGSVAEGALHRSPVSVLVTR